MGKETDPRRRQLRCYPFTVAVDTQFSDMDMAAHLNNVAIARFYESARSRLHLSLFGRELYDRQSRYRVVVAEINMRFLGEGAFPDPVHVGCGIARIGKSSYGVLQGLFQGDLCIGIADCALVLTAGGKPTTLPDGVRHAMQSVAMDLPAVT